MLLKELLSLANLTRVQTLCIYELTEVIMISKNKSFVFAAFSIVAPSFENFNNSQKLTIISVLLSFSQKNFSQKIGYQILSAQTIQSQLT